MNVIMIIAKITDNDTCVSIHVCIAALTLRFSMLNCDNAVWNKMCTQGYNQVADCWEEEEENKGCKNQHISLFFLYFVVRRKSVSQEMTITAEVEFQSLRSTYMMLEDGNAKHMVTVVT